MNIVCTPTAKCHRRFGVWCVCVCLSINIFRGIQRLAECNLVPCHKAVENLQRATKSYIINTMFCSLLRIKRIQQN